MPNFDEIKPGIANERVFTVEENLTVSHTKVPVLGTPMMIGLMELVSKDLVQPLLPSGHTTVGYEVNVKHKAPAFVGDKIKVWSKLLEADGRKLLYEVRVTHGDKVIGEGLHRRTVIQVSE